MDAETGVEEVYVVVDGGADVCSKDVVAAGDGVVGMIASGHGEAGVGRKQRLRLIQRVCVVDLSGREGDARMVVDARRGCGGLRGGLAALGIVSLALLVVDKQASWQIYSGYTGSRLPIAPSIATPRRCHMLYLHSVVLMNQQLRRSWRLPSWPSSRWDAY